VAARMGSGLSVGYDRPEGFEIEIEVDVVDLYF
jgi:hypothetical protein